MSSFVTPRFIPLRYTDSDIYGFTGLLNNDPNGIDSTFPVWPFWNSEESNGGLTAGHIVREGTQGMMVGGGAVGKNADTNLTFLSSPFETQDLQVGETPPKRPIWNQYQWYDPADNRVKGSNQNTFSAAFHEGYYINQSGKLRSLGTGYNFKPAQPRMFNNTGPILSNGADPRIFEIWQDDPAEFGFDGSIELKHICVAADECIMTLDTNGTIRIVQSGSTGVDLFDMNTDQDMKVVYFDKEDLEDHFWIDETGTPVVIDNVDFVNCWASGGGVGTQGICVWALKNDGTLYYQDMHQMVWQDVDFFKRNPFNGNVNVEPRVEDQGKWRSEPFMIQRGDFDDGETIGPGGPFLLNPYHGAATTLQTEHVDRNGYRAVRFNRVSSMNGHISGIEAWHNFTIPAGLADESGDFVKLGWNYESGRNALNQIPKNENGNRFKVLSLFDGYGHGGGCLCVDPDEPIDDDGSSHPNQMVEPVLLNSWAGGLHSHMYETLHKIKRYRTTKIGLNFSYSVNDSGPFQFKQDLFDLLFLDNETGRYVPPRRFGSSRRNFTLITNVGMIASFQGAGDGDESGNQGDATFAGGIAPLVNYEIDSTGQGLPPSGNFKLILDRNGDHRDIENGNWMYNCETNSSGNMPIEWNDGRPTPEDNTFEAILADGVLAKWFTSQSDPSTGSPTMASDPFHGRHAIGAPGEQNGRFGFGHMPPNADGTHPGVGSDAAVDLTEIFQFGFPVWVISYFPWTIEAGYDYEKYYWNQDSLVYLDPGTDAAGNDPLSSSYNKGSSIIHVWHAGEGSPVEPFASNPVVWWHGQGDNINVIFQNGVIDSCSYYTTECASMVIPPFSVPVFPIEEKDDDPVQILDPDPPLAPEELIDIIQDTETGPGSTEGGGEDPEDPGCDTAAEEDEPDIDKDEDIQFP